MDIVLTGTGSPLPDAARAGPSTLVKVEDDRATHVCALNDVIRAAEHVDGEIVIGDDLNTITI